MVSSRHTSKTLYFSFWLRALISLGSSKTSIHCFCTSLRYGNQLVSTTAQTRSSETFRDIFLAHKTINSLQNARDSEDSIDSKFLSSLATSVRPVSALAVPAPYMYWFETLNEMYTSTSSIRCPFFRRRISDIIDALAMIGRFLIIRHKSLIDPASLDPALLPAIPGCLPPTQINSGRHSDGQKQESAKLQNLPVEQVAALLQKDWEGKKKGRGYYITGKLNTLLYENDCLFDGPDPDMPVRGLRKYLSAASHLFDHNRSYAHLLDLTYSVEMRTVTAHWKLGGVLMLPWRPKVKDWTGSTIYHLDEKGLIYLHEERWDISVMEAFVCTAFPKAGKMIWGEDNM